MKEDERKKCDMKGGKIKYDVKGKIRNRFERKKESEKEKQTNTK